jgi:hypothetical protein
MKFIQTTLIAACLMLTGTAAISEEAATGCEAKAVSKAGKPLAGAAKAAFMKKCERDNKKDTTAVASTGSTQQNKMKQCNMDAKNMKGDERKAFMSNCLKG